MDSDNESKRMKTSLTAIVPVYNEEKFVNKSLEKLASISSVDDILLVDDILESGRTLSFAKDMLLDRGAKSVKLCVFLNKSGKRKVDIESEFVGFECPDLFVVGYGLDYNEIGRNLPHIYKLKE